MRMIKPHPETVAYALVREHDELIVEKGSKYYLKQRAKSLGRKQQVWYRVVYAPQHHVGATFPLSQQVSA